jgi:hypothetical protein
VPEEFRDDADVNTEDETGRERGGGVAEVVKPDRR